MVHSIDESARIVAVSDKWLEKLGHQRADVLGRSVWDFFTAASRTLSATVNRSDFLKTGSSENIPYEMVCNDGSVIQVLLSALPDPEAAPGQGRRSTSIISDISVLTATKARLRESEARYRALVEDQTDLLSLCKPDGELIFVNQAYATIHKLTADELTGRNLLDVVPADARDVVAAHLRAVCKSNVPLASENQIVIPPYGQVRWFAWVNRAITDETGAVTMIHSTGRDITEQKRAAAALAESESRLSLITANMSDLVTCLNFDLQRTYVSPASFAMLGYQPEEMLGLTPESICHAEDWPRLRGLFADVLRGEPVKAVEFRAVCKDGRTLWVQGNADTDWQAKVIVIVLRDISQRREMEEALRQSESELRMITGNINDMVSCMTFDLRRTYVSPSSFSLLGYRPEEMIGTTPQAICHPDDWPDVRDVFAALLRGESAPHMASRVLRKDGSVISVEVSVKIDREAELIIVTVRDISARRKMQQALQASQERLSLAVDAGSIGIWDWNIIDNTMFWDGWMSRFYGVAEGEIRDTLQIWSQLLHPDDRERAGRVVADAIAGVAPLDFEFRVLRQDGTLRHLRSTGRVVRDDAGRALRMVGANWDVTERRELAAALAMENELRRVTMESIGDGVITTDAMGLVTWLNPMAERMTGWPAAEAEGQPFETVFNIIHADTREPAENPLTACLAHGKITGLAEQTVLLARDGVEFGIDDSAAPIRGVDGVMRGMVLVFHDVTEQRRLSGEISYRASHDPLTGLLNRSEFDARMRRLVPKVQSECTENALLFIDLDQFKIVNDTAGHAVGDRLLQQVAKLLADVVRGSDAIARLGGDEFAVILESCPPAPALRLAQRICARMDEFRFVHEDRVFRIGASVGLVSWDERWGSVAAIVQAADSACYAAKEAGRNRVHVWSDSNSDLQLRQRQTQWASRLTSALDEDRFVLFVQRIEPLQGADAGVHGEVLLRMVDDDGTLLAPGAFLPAAERFHLASRIDRWVLTHVIAWARTQRDLEWLTLLSVNLSGQSVGDRMFHAWAMQCLRDAGPDFCSRLCFEITETAAIANMADAQVFLRQVRDVGVRVALDDFGAGASSFGYLKSMPVDFLKIDGQFVRDLLTSDLNQAAVRCFADVASVVGMRTVAEFVDKAEIMARLREMGIDFAQGYHIHRPAPIAELSPAALSV